MCNPDRRSANSSTMALHKAWFFKIGVMSLNTMPGCGKSGISRMADFICSSNILLVEFQVGFNFTQKLRVHSIHPSEVGQRPEAAMWFPITNEQGGHLLRNLGMGCEFIFRQLVYRQLLYCAIFYLQIRLQRRKQIVGDTVDLPQLIDPVKAT